MNYLRRVFSYNIFSIFMFIFLFLISLNYAEVEREEAATPNLCDINPGDFGTILDWTNPLNRDNNSVIVVESNDFNCDKNLTVDSFVLEIKGELSLSADNYLFTNCIFYSGNTQGAILETNGSKVEIHDSIFSTSLTPGPDAIRNTGDNELLLNNVTIDDTFSRAIHQQSSSSITISNSRIDSFTFMTFDENTSNFDITITESEITSDQGINISPPAVYSDPTADFNVTIENNYISPAGSVPAIHISDGDLTSNPTWTIIRNNMIRDLASGASFSIDLEVDNAIIQDNDILVSGAPGFIKDNIGKSIEISRNQFSSSSVEGSAKGIDMTNSVSTGTEISIANNFISWSNADEPSIWINTAMSNVDIQDNNITAHKAVTIFAPLQELKMSENHFTCSNKLTQFEQQVGICDIFDNEAYGTAPFVLKCKQGKFYGNRISSEKTASTPAVELLNNDETVDFKIQNNTITGKFSFGIRSSASSIISENELIGDFDPSTDVIENEPETVGIGIECDTTSCHPQSNLIRGFPVGISSTIKGKTMSATQNNIYQVHTGIMAKKSMEDIIGNVIHALAFGINNNGFPWNGMKDNHIFMKYNHVHFNNSEEENDAIVSFGIAASTSNVIDPTRELRFRNNKIHNADIGVSLTENNDFGGTVIFSHMELRNCQIGCEMELNNQAQVFIDSNDFLGIQETGLTSSGESAMTLTRNRFRGDINSDFNTTAAIFTGSGTLTAVNNDVSLWNDGLSVLLSSLETIILNENQFFLIDGSAVVLDSNSMNMTQNCFVDLENAILVEQSNAAIEGEENWFGHETGPSGQWNGLGSRISSVPSDLEFSIRLNPKTQSPISHPKCRSSLKIDTVRPRLIPYGENTLLQVQLKDGVNIGRFEFELIKEDDLSSVETLISETTDGDEYSMTISNSTAEGKYYLASYSKKNPYIRSFSKLQVSNYGINIVSKPRIISAFDQFEIGSNLRVVNEIYDPIDPLNSLNATIEWIIKDNQYLNNNIQSIPNEPLRMALSSQALLNSNKDRFTVQVRATLYLDSDEDNEPEQISIESRDKTFLIQDDFGINNFKVTPREGFAFRSNFTISFDVIPGNRRDDMDIDFIIGYNQQPRNKRVRPIPVPLVRNEYEFSLPFIRNNPELKLYILISATLDGRKFKTRQVLEDPISVLPPCPKDDEECIANIRDVLDSRRQNNSFSTDEELTDDYLTRISFEDYLGDFQAAREIREEAAREVRDRYKNGNAISTVEGINRIFSLISTVCDRTYLSVAQTFRMVAAEALQLMSGKAGDFVLDKIRTGTSIDGFDEYNDVFTLGFDSAAEFVVADDDDDDLYISDLFLDSMRTMSWIRTSAASSEDIVEYSSNENVTFTGIKFSNASSSSVANSLQLNSNSSKQSVQFPSDFNIPIAQETDMHIHLTHFVNNPFGFANETLIEEDESIDDSLIFSESLSESSSNSTNITRATIYETVVSGVSRVQILDREENSVPVEGLKNDETVKICFGLDQEELDRQFDENAQNIFNATEEQDKKNINQKLELRYWSDEEKKWKCEDDALQKEEDDNLYCGETTHFSEFAVVRIMWSYDYNIPQGDISIDDITENWAIVITISLFTAAGIAVFSLFVICDIRDTMGLRKTSEYEFETVVENANQSRLYNSENFWHRMALLLRKDHRLIGIIFRRVYDPYTRSQRVSVILTSIAVNVAVNSLVYNIDNRNIFDAQEAIKFIIMGAITTIITTPVPVLLSALWRSIRPSSVHEEKLAQMEQIEKEKANQYPRRFPWVFTLVTGLLLIAACVFCSISVWQFYGSWWEAVVISVVILIVGGTFIAFKTRTVNFSTLTEKNYRLLPFLSSSITMWIFCILICGLCAGFTIYVGVSHDLASDEPGRWVLSVCTSIVLNLAQLSTIVISISLALTASVNSPITPSQELTSDDNLDL